jgi:hypothetical protein
MAANNNPSFTQGAPIGAFTPSTSSTAMPAYMQRFGYNIVNNAANLADRPYVPYNKQILANLDPMQLQAYRNVQQNQGNWNPDLNFASQGTRALSGMGTADQFNQMQGQYLRPDLINQNLNAGQQYFNQAGQSADQIVGQYMNPYQQSVLDTIAKQGARNLSENLLPGVSDAFVRAGSFGGTGMGEFGSRAVRDTQEAILQQQSQAAQSGYAQALNAAQNDLSRYGNLGQMQTAAGQQQQGYGFDAADRFRNAQAGDYERRIGAMNNIAAMAGDRARLSASDNAQLEAAGQTMTAQQQGLNTEAYNRWNMAQDYPWLNAERARNLAQGTQVPTYSNANQYNISGYAPSPYSATMGGLSYAAGAGQQDNQRYRGYP